MLLGDRTHLEANCDAEADQEDGDGQLVEDSERAEDVAKDLLQEELLSEHGQHAQHVQDIEHRNRCDERRHEGLEVVALPGKDRSCKCTSLAGRNFMYSTNHRKSFSLFVCPFLPFRFCPTD